MQSNTRSSMSGGQRRAADPRRGVASVLAGWPDAPRRRGTERGGARPRRSTGRRRWRARADEARAKGDTELALRLYIEAAEHDPEDAESLYPIGSIYEERDDVAASPRGPTREPCRSTPARARARGSRAALFRDRQLEPARPMLSRAVAPTPAWRSHNALGLIADTRGDHGDGCDALRGGARRVPRSGAILNNRGYSSYLAGSRGSRARLPRRLAVDPMYDGVAESRLGVRAAGRLPDGAGDAQARRGAPMAANDVGYIAMVSGDYAAAERSSRTPSGCRRATTRPPTRTPPSCGAAVATPR